MNVDPHADSFGKSTTNSSVVRGRDPSALAAAQHAELDESNSQERGILLSLHESILKNFQAFLRLVHAAQHSQNSETVAGDHATAVVFGGEPSEHPLQLLGLKDSDPNLTISSQTATLQRAFIQFYLWSKEYDVSSGALDRTLAVIKDLRQEVILVLLQLCDALYHGLLLLLESSTETLDRGTYPETIRLLEVAKSYVGEDDYLGVDNTSYFTIVDEISTSLEGLGDLSFCLEASAPAAITHHVTENYTKFMELKELRIGANEAEPQADPDKKRESLLPTNTADVDTPTASRIKPLPESPEAGVARFIAGERVQITEKIDNKQRKKRLYVAFSRKTSNLKIEYQLTTEKDDTTVLYMNGKWFPQAAIHIL